MGSKKYKGQKCVYCGIAEAATADHVLARGFVIPARRNDIPKVPACAECNRAKSQLEHYLTAVLPFGAKHADAVENLATMVPSRLDKNATLRAELKAGLESTLYSAAPLQHEAMERLFSLIAQGLLWYHWQAVLGSGYSAASGFFSDFALPKINEHLFESRAKSRVSGNIGGDVLSYEGYQAIEDSSLSAWRFQMYGGMQFGGDSRPGEIASHIIAITGHNALINRLKGTVFALDESAIHRTQAKFSAIT